jgi:hypothetical protein
MSTWRDRLAAIGFVVILVGGALLFSSFLLTPLFDQARLPLFIAAVSSLLSASGVMASWLVVLEMRKDRETLFKPDVSVNIEMESHLLLFVVRNDGKSPAHNVVVKVDPSPIDHTGKAIVEETPWLQAPIPTLLPGNHLAKTIGSHTSIFKEDIPRTFTVELEYESSSGKKYTEKPFILDFDQYRGSKLPTPSLEYSLSRLTTLIESLEKKIKA